MRLAIEGRQLVKSYRDGDRVTEVLRGVDLGIATGEMVSIVGPSGSGKSTLLHLLGGLDRPDAGEVKLAGQALAGLSRSELADLRNRTLGFVFQFHQLLPDFTALENVMMPGRIAGMAVRAARQHSLDLLAEVGLLHRIDHFPSQLSGGERQRVALCRALVLQPAVLLADEPTGNLDPENGAQVLDLLLGLRESRGITALLVTHNPAVAGRCARVLTLNAGRIETPWPSSEG